MSRPVVEFFYDIVSPYSYLAAERLGELDAVADVRWQPFFLPGLFQATGNAAPGLHPLKGKYLFQDISRLAAYYGLPLKFPSQFPTNTVNVQRALLALDETRRPAASLALFRAYWAEGRDILDRQLLTELVGESAVERALHEDIKQALRSATEQAAARGAFGAPTFFLGDEMYWGEDRLFLLVDRLKQGA